MASLIKTKTSILATKKKNKPFWCMKASVNQNGDMSGEIYIYGDIIDVTPNRFLADLERLGDIEELNVHIYSCGGSLYAGNAIYSILKGRKERTNAYVEGLAASAATIIAMGCDRVYISENGMMMFHNPMLPIDGLYNVHEITGFTEELKKAAETMVTAYCDKTGLNEETINSILYGINAQGTFLSAKECIDYGFADEITPEIKTILGGVKMAAKAKVRAKGKGNSRTKVRAFAKAKKYKSIRAELEEQTDIEVIETICPHCGSAFSLSMDISEEAEIQCPHCGEIVLLVPLDTSSNSSEIANNATEDEDEILADIESGTTQNVECPECNASFEWETDDIEGGESTLIVCPECGAEFSIENNSAEHSEDESTITAVYKRGIRAERKRQKTLNDMANSFPEHGQMVDAFKKSGSSIQAAMTLLLRAKATSKHGSAMISAFKRDSQKAKLVGRPINSNGSGRAAMLHANISRLRGTDR